MFYLCAQRWGVWGRVARAWIVEANERPDTPDGSGTVAYPFNERGGEVISAWTTRSAAIEAEDCLWREEYTE